MSTSGMGAMTGMSNSSSTGGNGGMSSGGGRGTGGSANSTFITNFSSQDNKFEKELNLDLYNLIHTNRITVIDNSNEAFSHYFSGNGSPVILGTNTIIAVLSSSDFQKKHARITGGKTTSLKGNFSVDLTSTVFHVGRTNVNYSISISGNGKSSVTYNLFVDDGFWDVDFIDEKIGNWFGIKNAPDGLGPNLERFGGTPYPYIPSTLTFDFPNPGYT